MGFWKNLKDAAPQKSHARATEVHKAGIQEMLPFPPEVSSMVAGKVCSICKATFGAAFAKDRTAYSVTVTPGSKLSFQEGDGMIVCNKCVEHFRF